MLEEEVAMKSMTRFRTPLEKSVIHLKMKSRVVIRTDENFSFLLTADDYQLRARHEKVVKTYSRYIATTCVQC